MEDTLEENKYNSELNKIDRNMKTPDEENEDFDDSDTEFDNDEEFSGAEDSEGNQIEAKKITFKLGAK